MADLPPSYHEAVSSPAVQRNQPLATPSAPQLEAIATDNRLGNTQGQPSQRGSLPHYAHNDERFSAWEDAATEILITNRLNMNERFENAQNQHERDELWHEIVNRLLAAGYSFARIDLIQYWEFLFYIYKSIVNNLSAGTQPDSNWKYFNLMDSVFNLTSKSAGEGDYAAMATTHETNTFGGLTNLGSISDALPSQPISSVYNSVLNESVITLQPNQALKSPAENGVITTQPTMANANVPINPNRNRYEDDDCCCCCAGCCDDPHRRSGGYSSTTGGYSSHDNYNTYDHTGYGYSSGFTGDCTGSYNIGDNIHTSSHNDDDNCLTSSHHNGDNQCHISSQNNDDGCCTSGGGDTGGGCTDTGGWSSGGCDSGGGFDSGGCDSGGGGGGCDD